MQISIQQLIFNNVVLKVTSLILGYCLWSMLGDLFQSTLWINVPLCFYNNEKNITIDAPESIQVMLSGKRSHLYNISSADLAIHINLNNLKSGDNYYILTDKNLFLPAEVKLTDYNPHNLMIKLGAPPQ